MKLIISLLLSNKNELRKVPDSWAAGGGWEEAWSLPPQGFPAHLPWTPDALKLHSFHCVYVKIQSCAFQVLKLC